MADGTGMADGAGQNRARLDVPWARCAQARALRELILVGLLGPAMDLYTRRRVVGRERLEGLEAPVLFVANHSSHMDTPAILRAMPRRWRRCTAVAAAADYFYRKRGIARAVSLVFNTVPMQRNGGGLEPSSTAHLGNLMDERWNLLVFAEGTRSRDGSVGRLRSGAAVLAAEHDLDIVPVYVSGTREAMPPGRRWMHRKPERHLSSRHPVEVRFGAPIRPRPGEHRTEVMERVRLFFAEAGATTTPGERVLTGEDRAAAGQPA
ncbi:MAG: lysophospholipid acyltransferase family protein [Thermoleophilaceae bacterium]